MSLDLGVLSSLFCHSLSFFVLFQRERLTNTLTGHFKQASERYRGGGEMKDSFDYLTHES